MPTATIAPNISATQTGNFQFTIVFNVSASQEVTGFSISNNLAGTTNSRVPKSNLTLLSFNNNAALIGVTLPDNVEESDIRIRLRRNVNVDGISEELTGEDKTITIDTRTDVDASFDTVRYNDDVSISVPVNFDTNITSLSYTDFILNKLLGDEIYGFETWLTGTGRNYELHVLPEIDTSGEFQIGLLGTVLTGTDATPKQTEADSIQVGYDARIPFVEDFYFPANIPNVESQNDKFQVYVQFNVRITGLNTDSFLYQGLDLGTPTIEKLTTSDLDEDGFAEDITTDDVTDDSLPTFGDDLPIGGNDGDLYLRTGTTAAGWYHNEDDTWEIATNAEVFSGATNTKWLGVGGFAESESGEVDSDEDAENWFTENLTTIPQDDVTYFWYNGTNIRKTNWTSITSSGNTSRSKFFRLTFNIAMGTDTNGIFSLILKDDAVINAEYITGETGPQPVRSPEEPAQDEEVIRPTGEFVRVGSSTNFGVNEIWPTGIAYNENDDILYMVGNTNDALFSLNFTTGAATRIGSATEFGVSERSPGGLTYNPNTDTLYFFGRYNDALYSLDVATGVATHLVTIVSPEGETHEGSIDGIAYDPTNDILYALGNVNNALYTINITNGNLSRIGSATDFGVGEGQPNGLAYDSNNGILYMVGRDNDVLYEVSTESGTSSRVGNINQFGLSEGTVGGLTYDPINRLLYMLGQSPSALLKGLTTTS